MVGAADSEKHILTRVQNPKKLASLIIMYLFACFFPKSGPELPWDLVKMCCNIKRMAEYNWAGSVIKFLIEGLEAHEEGTAHVFNGCTLLPVYVYLERSRIRKPRDDITLAGRPRFVQWDLQTIFADADLKNWPELVADKFNEGQMTRQKTSPVAEAEINVDRVTGISGPQIEIHKNRVRHMREHLTDLIHESADRRTRAEYVNVF